jgi:hypothetical protein
MGPQGKLQAMPNWKEGDHVRVVNRPVTEEDRRKNRYFEHMAGLTGTIQSTYSAEEIAIRVDPDALKDVTKEVHKVSVNRMRENFVSKVSEEQKKQLTAEELNFDAHFVILVRSADLEKV